jgi:hypothetical protein
MKDNPKVIDYLNKALRHELTPGLVRPIRIRFPYVSPCFAKCPRWTLAGYRPIALLQPKG